MSAVQSVHLNALISAHLYQGLKNDCGPYCAAIVLKVMGNEIEADLLADQLNKPRWKNGFPIIRRIPKGPTFPWGLAESFSTRGIKAEWKILVSKSKLIHLLNSGDYLIVFIGTLLPLWAHTMILVAFDEVKGVGFVDPALDLKEIHWMSEDCFFPRWSLLGRNVLSVKQTGPG